MVLFFDGNFLKDTLSQKRMPEFREWIQNESLTERRCESRVMLPPLATSERGRKATWRSVAPQKAPFSICSICSKRL